MMTIDCIDETSSPSILVVEDDANALSLLRACLARNGYGMTSAGTLAEARRRLHARSDWGFVILDRRLPDGDGASLCAVIRATQTHSYILMLTGEATAEAKIEGFESGVDDYVTKPFEIDELLARIRAGMRIVELQKELLASSRRYEALSLTDSLTSLRNRRSFDQEFESRFDHARRYERPLSLVIIDLDYFKSINDQFGHSAGDGVLRGIAQILDHGTRRSDFVSRIGGEEFAVLLPETSLFEALHFAEKIRSTVMTATIRTEAATHKVTVSIGVANVPHSLVTTAQEFFNAADQALYRAKARGRNRIESERRKVPVREALGDTRLHMQATM
ncbi:MAG: two-component system, cell cycle response regulator [Thermoanaerobaculia bacterium]|jgi:diguanylate cyclase (GGDEF)-like protein|nr:two-component system, cell cycle response regulator [Thermoanaerobaculia bacterium]